MRVEDRTILACGPSARGPSLRKRSHEALAALTRLRSRRSGRGVAFTEYLVLVSVVALGLGAAMQTMQRSMADTGASAGERVQAVINGSVQAPSAILPHAPGANALNRDPVPPYGPRDQGGVADAAHEQIVEDGKRYDKILRDNPGYLKQLPGGTKPTREELAMTDAIVRKYEAELRLHQGEPGFDAVDLTKRMGQELEPLAAKHRNDFTWWADMVKTNSVLDLKNRSTGAGGEKVWNEQWNFSSAGIPKGADTKDAAGNWLFGYLGSEVFGAGPLGQGVLIGGAGLAQALADGKDKTLKRLEGTGWLDNPGDKEKISAGIKGYIDDNGPVFVFAQPGEPSSSNPPPPAAPPAGWVPGPSNRDDQLNAELAKAGVIDAAKGTATGLGALVEKGVDTVVGPLLDWERSFVNRSQVH